MRVDHGVRMFAEQLRRARLAAGLSLSDLAKRVHYSKGYLSKIENGHNPASVDLARRCDAELGADGRLASLVTQPVASSGGSLPEREGVWSEEVWTLNLGPDGSTWFSPMLRRTALSTAAALLTLGLTERCGSAMQAEESGLAAFQGMFEQFRLLGRSMSPSMVLPALIAQTNTLRGLVGTASSPMRERFLLLASRYAEYTGWLSQEAGSDRAALWWTQTAVEMADAAGDHEMGAHGLVRHALIALYRDDATLTVDLARRAQADGRASARVRGMAALREAQGHALAGEDKLCHESLDQARRLREIGGPDMAGDIALGPAAGSAIAPLVTGWCLYDLGRPAEAATVLDRELDRLPVVSRRSEARFGARQALAHAAVGDVDHACALTHRVLDHAEAVDSATIRYDLRMLTRTLGRWASRPAVSELQPRLSMALHAPVV